MNNRADYNAQCITISLLLIIGQIFYTLIFSTPLNHYLQLQSLYLSNNIYRGFNKYLSAVRNNINYQYKLEKRNEYVLLLETQIQQFKSKQVSSNHFERFKKMSTQLLIDGSHKDQVQVALVEDQKIKDFEFESNFVLHNIFFNSKVC